MLRFNRLRVSGFKSFVDPTEFIIEQGLTGVVGPNGCGKSNLVEALRWVMGETSAKQMRGSGMDDVIFGGTSERPSRNIAEVVLSLDNTDRTAPSQFNDFDELEVSRRIERDEGSTYRVNGKEVRAKDVQLLFADSSTGARSTAMVSQGRIGAVISAKPAQRRSLLEEAAGISGLHSRRHEAELRLRGADTNLERLEDILGTLDGQMQNLKKQARQANRYRNLSDLIRKAEAALLHLRWISAEGDLEDHRQHLSSITRKVEELSRETARAATQQGETASGLPELRQAEAAAAAELHRLGVAREGLDEEARRIAEASAETEVRIGQITDDLARETALTADAEAALKSLKDEQARIEGESEGEEESARRSQENLDAANLAVAEMDTTLSALTDEFAANEARRTSLIRSIDELTQRRARLDERARDIGEQRTRLEAEAIDPEVLAAAERDMESGRARLEEARTRTESCDAQRGAAQEAQSAAVARRHAVEQAETRLLAEEQALADVLGATGDGDWPALIDEVTVTPGFESALGVALGEDLSAPTDETAPVRWRTLDPMDNPPALPEGAEPLSLFVTGPAALRRCLSQIGVVYDGTDGNRLSDQLHQGQCLVSRNGGLWRWDGFTVTAGAETAAAARLKQRNRLGEVRQHLGGAAASVAAATSEVATAQAALEAAQAAEREARSEVTAADRAFGQARESLAEIKERAARHSSRLTSLIDTIKTIEADIAETEGRATEAKEGLGRLADAEIGRRKIADLRADLAERRALQVECQSAFDQLRRAAEERRRRLADIERELASWLQRLKAAGEHIEQLQERLASERAELQRLAALPGEIAQKRQALLGAIERAEQARREKADRLATTENRLAEVEKALRAAEAALAAARENRVRSEGLVEQAEQALGAIAERTLDKLDATPDQLAEIAGIDPDKDLPDLEATEKKVERLNRERETMGPVNLRAEQETQELTEQITTLVTERDDLIEAIEKLRRGISELNREGRQRLLESFHEVDKHFQELFVRLFGGGQAHLQLTDSDDPLEAGLEIMASPPGKRLQVLSLLSGGEQALTALALLFGVFLTNPAPICVLDEVDAPLDDANVDRFCSMLSEMANSGMTKFVVITHHRMTMARMERLFGVTMAERGVSQLVSVDLQLAEELRATA